MTNKAIARGFVARLSQTNEAEAVKELAALVILNKKTKGMQFIIEEIRNEIDRVNRHVIADVGSVRKISDKQLFEIEQLVKKMTEAKTVQLETYLNPELIGGFKISAPNFEYDASVATKIRQLKGV
jgi:F0F1-type ATP synthase delta subunit